MASALYDLYRQAALDADVDWTADTIKAALVRSSAYTPNMATDQFMSTVVAGGATVARSSAFASKTSTAGVADAADITFTTVAAGAAIQYIVIFKDTGSDATSPVIALIDTATGLPVTPNGGDIIVQWDNGANKIFKL